MPPAAVIPTQLTTRALDIDDARRFGLTREHLRGSRWRRLGCGFYALREIANDPIVLLGAVSRRMPVGAVFSGRTAAWLHGLDVPPCDPIEVTLPPARLMSRMSGTLVRRSRLSPCEVARRRCLPVTSIDRTIADLGRRLPLIEAVTVLDMAMHRRLVSEAHLQAWIARHPSFPGIACLRRAIGLAELGTESVMETRLRLLLVLAGLPRPRVQVSLRDDGGHFLGRPDLYYPTHRLALEYDGAGHRERLAADNRRQNRLMDAGYRLLRFTAFDVLSTPHSVVTLVSRALDLDVGLPPARAQGNARNNRCTE